MNSTLYLIIAIKNEGRTHAKQIVINCKVTAHPEVIEGKIKGEVVNEHLLFGFEQLGPGKMEAIRTDTSTGIPEDHVETLRRDGVVRWVGTVECSRPAISITGSVTYEDIFGDEHEAAFGHTFYSVKLGEATHFFVGTDTEYERHQIERLRGAF